MAGNRLGGKKSSSNLQGGSSDAFGSSCTLFISSLLFHLSRALLGAWHFILFRSVYPNFHNWLDLQGACLLLGVLFYFPQFILVCFIICKNEKMKKFNKLAISWPPWVRVWGWASYRFLPFTVFSLGLPFCFSSYIVHLRCRSGGGGGGGGV